MEQGRSLVLSQVHQSVTFVNSLTADVHSLTDTRVLEHHSDCQLLLPLSQWTQKIMQKRKASCWGALSPVECSPVACECLCFL